MTLEYLKKNRWTLLKQSIVIGAILLIVFLALVASLLLSPVGLGFLTLLSVNPVGFFFLFVLGLCFLSMAGSVAWLLMSEKSAVLTPTSEGEKNMCDEKTESNPNQRLLSNGFNSSDSNLAISILDENETEKDVSAKNTGENTRENKVKKNVERCPTLEEYSQQSEQFISDARAAISHNTIKTPKVFNELEQQFNALKKTYYQLARNLHPDKNPQIKEDAFKELGNYYENITEMFDRLKTLHNEKDIWELLNQMDKTFQEIRDQQAQMLRYLQEMKNHSAEMKKYIEKADNYIEKADNYIEKADNYIEEADNYIERIKQGRKETRETFETLKNLYDQGAIDISNPELQKQLALFSATFYANRDMSEQQSDKQKTDTRLDIMPQNDFGFFSKVTTIVGDWISGIKKANTCTNPEPIPENSDASELDKINASPRLYSNDT